MYKYLINGTVCYTSDKLFADFKNKPLSLLEKFIPYVFLW